MTIKQSVVPVDPRKPLEVALLVAASMATPPSW